MPSAIAAIKAAIDQHLEAGGVVALVRLDGIPGSPVGLGDELFVHPADWSQAIAEVEPFLLSGGEVPANVTRLFGLAVESPPRP